MKLIRMGSRKKQSWQDYENHTPPFSLVTFATSAASLAEQNYKTYLLKAIRYHTQYLMRDLMHFLSVVSLRLPSQSEVPKPRMRHLSEPGGHRGAPPPRTGSPQCRYSEEFTRNRCPPSQVPRNRIESLLSDL